MAMITGEQGWSTLEREATDAVATLRAKLVDSPGGVVCCIYSRRVVDRMLSLLTESELCHVHFKWFDTPQPTATVNLPAEIE